jgi:RNA polymerase sigma factor (sigma-70 family)
LVSPPEPVSGKMSGTTGWWSRHAGQTDPGFEEAFRGLFVLAHRVARRILADPDRAEDVAAEALSRAYAHWDRIGDQPYRDAWVVKVASNLALNIVRRRPPPLPRDVVLSEEDAAVNHVLLVDALAQVSARQREVLVLRHLAGFSEPEIATHLGLGLGTVKTHLRRGREAMQTQLGTVPGEVAGGG